MKTTSIATKAIETLRRLAKECEKAGLTGAAIANEREAYRLECALLSTLRVKYRNAVAKRASIDSCASPEWLEAHRSLSAIGEMIDAIVARLARNSETRNGAWSTIGERELMRMGYL